MAKEKKDFGSLRYKIFDGKDSIFDEKGSTFLAMRKLAWYSEGDDEPTEDDARLDMRKWKAKDDGNDMPLKGFSFLTEEGPHCLAETLVDNGYGKTPTILKSLKNRDDFKDSVEHMYDEEDNSGEDYFDARSELLS